MCFLNVENIRLINFRNYNNICLNLNKNINIFIGRNAQGKTNLMESIYMCSTGRSFRTNRDKEIISFNKDEAYIGANINLGDYKRFIEIKMHQDKAKRIRINKTELTNYRELSSGLNVVVFTPEDLRIVKDGPQERRNLIDNSINQLKPVYNYNLNKYKKILIQRNNLLKSSRFKKNITDLLDIFDLQIAKIGTSIVLERNRYIKELAIQSREIHCQVTKGAEDLGLDYLSNVPLLESREEVETEYLKLLKKTVKRDLEYGSTEIGPHRDDMGIYLNRKDARIYGSQGQQRTIVLSLKLGEVKIIKEDRGLAPLLILDDVFSELDQERKTYLINQFKNMQTLITTTDYDDLKILENMNKSIFRIRNGSLERKEN